MDEENRPTESEFESLASGRKSSLPGEFIEFLKYNKKWWLTPIVVVLLLLGLLALALLGHKGKHPLALAHLLRAALLAAHVVVHAQEAGLAAQLVHQVRAQLANLVG